MKRNGRARNGVEAKRRRARIARRLARADVIRGEMDYARRFLFGAGSPAQVVGYDRRRRTVIVEVVRPAYAKDIEVTIGFSNPEPPVEARLIQPGPSPKMERAKELVRLFGEGKIRIDPPLPEVSAPGPGEAALDDYRTKLGIAELPGEAVARSWLKDLSDEAKRDIAAAAGIPASRLFFGMGAPGSGAAIESHEQMMGRPILCLAIIENDRGEADTCGLPRDHKGECDWRAY